MLDTQGGTPLLELPDNTGAKESDDLAGQVDLHPAGILQFHLNPAVGPHGGAPLARFSGFAHARTLFWSEWNSAGLLCE
jgi:hypothetical protein